MRLLEAFAAILYMRSTPAVWKMETKSRDLFYLVTNGGEREIPYSLRIQTGTGGEELASLKTARDFANLARKNIELALRLFEYQDFIQAPFMQEPEARSIYEGLREETEGKICWKNFWWLFM